MVRLPASAVAADRDMARFDPLLAQEAPRFQRVLVRRRIRMLGRKPIVDRKRAHARRAAGLGHHAAMADDRARAIAATVKEQQHARGVAPRHDRPFAVDGAEIDLLELDVAGDRPGRADLVDARPPLAPAHRARLCRQQRADGVDFAHEQAFRRRFAMSITPLRTPSPLHFNACKNCLMFSCIARSFAMRSRSAAIGESENVAWPMLLIG